jgi:hypothetical protein
MEVAVNFNRVKSKPDIVRLIQPMDYLNERKPGESDG